MTHESNNASDLDWQEVKELGVLPVDDDHQDEEGGEQ